MKINVVLGHSLPFPPTKGGGIENINFSLAKAFAALGHQVVVYSRHESGLKRKETDEFGIRHVRLDGFDWTSRKPIDALNSLRWCTRLSKNMEPADVTLFNTLFSFLLGNSGRFGIRASTIQRTPTRWKVRLFKKMDRVYCPSDAVLRQAQEACPAMKNLKRIYNCIELPVAAPPAPSTKKQGLTFLYLGRFVRDKGLEYLVKGFQASLAQFPDNRLVTMGPQTGRSGADEPFLAEMKQYIADCDIADRVSFEPPTYDRRVLERAIVDADVICVPTLWGETFSAAILEAMVFAKPVLVSDFGPMPEAVDHLNTGFVSKAADAGSLAEGFRFFSGNADRLEELGRNAREKVREFSSEKIAGEYLADFHHLLKTKTQRIAA